ncbi:class D beta-lactamase [Carboxylicivirga sediminis]|uniref:Class D beta-lactamase n=1 Tax=Carboxylicivirga sediminis TaxID=2006564 RepID=A0A941F941_9BACT|nr:class D beta-lactamase [Carboxylicivirga sediminis]MBR8537350.1 class D beta-lactamase [Carboxylicivirga sediminis]
MLRYLLFFGLLLFATSLGAQTTTQEDLNLESVFEGTTGTFVLYNVGGDNYKVYNADRASQAFSVHSTSKIVWSIIGLEEGLIANDAAVMKWDKDKYLPEKFWPEGWSQDQTVVSALKYSVNWYYFELMPLMTPEMVEQYLNRLDYQPGFQVEKLHYFGLTYQIEKSAMEQIAFLRQLYTNAFNLSPSTVSSIKKGMLQEQNDDYTLYYKTGAGEIRHGNCIGWVIGFVEKGDELYYFAMNIEDKDFKSILGKRIVITKEVLKELGVSE